MPLYRDEGVVLRTHKLGEADRIVTIFAKDRGIIRAVAKGVRRTSSKFGARLEPFMLVDLLCYEGRSLDTITQAETLAAYGAQISTDFDVFRAANVMAETAERLNTDGPARSQYALLVGALRTLAAGEIDWSLVRDAYLIRAVSLAGWAPSFDECVVCGTPGPHSHVSIQLGGVTCASCKSAGTHSVDAATLELLGALLEGDWATTLASQPRARQQASGFAATYVQWHLERGIKSLNVSRTTR